MEHRVPDPDSTHKIERKKKVFILVYFRWSNSLQAARVTRWGGMISTPDAVLQAVIKRALIDSGSPSHIVNELMENAHERRWPSGLSTLETRQLNRRQYENYVTKRIPGEFIRKKAIHWLVGLLCLTPLSTIFQFYCWRKRPQVTDKLLSHFVLLSTPRHEWGSNSQC